MTVMVVYCLDRVSATGGMYRDAVDGIAPIRSWMAGVVGRVEHRMTSWRCLVVGIILVTPNPTVRAIVRGRSRRIRMTISTRASDGRYKRDQTQKRRTEDTYEYQNGLSSRINSLRVLVE